MLGINKQTDLVLGFHRPVNSTDRVTSEVGKHALCWYVTPVEMYACNSFLTKSAAFVMKDNARGATDHSCKLNFEDVTVREESLFQRERERESLNLHGEQTH